MFSEEAADKIASDVTNNENWSSQHNPARKAHDSGAEATRELSWNNLPDLRPNVQNGSTGARTQELENALKV